MDTDGRKRTEADGSAAKELGQSVLTEPGRSSPTRSRWGPTSFLLQVAPPCSITTPLKGSCSLVLLSHIRTDSHAWTRAQPQGKALHSPGRRWDAGDAVPALFPAVLSWA